MPRQLDFFGAVQPQPATPELRALAGRLPSSLWLGGMSWSYPGWNGSVYAAELDEKRLSHAGLPAYAAHPLLRAVELDRTYYGPIRAEVFTEYAAQVPDDFRFTAKAHADCTIEVFPLQPRYGARQGQTNPRFLDAAYAADEVVAPFVEGLREKGAVLLFQFSPMRAEPGRFAERLHRFLSQLPRGPAYAVELRNRELLTAEYALALADTGVTHCHNAWGAMPGVLEQRRALGKGTPPPVLVRWLMRPGDAYGVAESRFKPFDRLREPDLTTRAEIAQLVVAANARGLPALVLVDNKAEGSAPATIAELAAEIVVRLEKSRSP